ncbi:tRNA (adenosine(37)-N6)-dimethylallyltransferase MiaA [Pediococcus stilesii]|uniref:tRNA dimethylallyltransferase n=1 Tax=Pediococcus stilesii TaxID=331679 RepID=A0A0R2L0V1_9LACO|nr:tRNA (adenosine(37)-N6)-dimethylallyltransferase MiaA [Pediococcus stilesii]KRN95294.1 tRNA delta(2)-isopentenylpyrophosphate transferase [Pediococcus stilesii]
MNKVLAIVGPTAVGKTQLSIEIAKRFNAEIISGDSMQVYRGLDIGTAKIMPEEMDGVRHHLIDIRNVQDSFTVQDFKSSAEKLIIEITNRNKVPLIVGGTGFYLQALLEDLELGGNTENREQVLAIRKTLDEKTDEELFQMLRKVDQKSANRIDQHNRRRMIRAIEVYELNGIKFSEQNSRKPPYDSLIIGLNTNRLNLYARINQRVDLMLQNGLLREAQWLFDQDEVPQATKGIGYREWESYFKGERSLEQVVELIKKDSRHYAKRQLTWFRNKMDVQWFDILQNESDQLKINQKIESWLNQKNELER